MIVYPLIMYFIQFHRSSKVHYPLIGTRHLKNFQSISRSMETPKCLKRPLSEVCICSYGAVLIVILYQHLTSVISSSCTAKQQDLGKWCQRQRQVCSLLVTHSSIRWEVSKDLLHVSYFSADIQKYIHHAESKEEFWPNESRTKRQTYLN